MSDYIPDEGAVMQIDSDDQVDVTELFSRPRLVPRCPIFHLIGGASFDLKDDSELDLGTVNGRASVWEHIRLYQPKVIVLSPPCTLFSQLMTMWGRKSMGEETFQRRLLEARRLLAFAAEIAAFQMKQNRFFIFEHPDGARSWNESCLTDLQDERQVFVTRFDQCVFGLKCPYTQEPIRKRTRLLTNLPEVNEIFGDKFCQCAVPHRRIEGAEGGIQISSYCETYPPDMVNALLRGVQAAVGVQMLD